MDQSDTDERKQQESFYAELSDEALIEIGSQFDSLTKLAQSVIRAEFERRALPAPEVRDSDDTFEFQNLITVRQYRDPVDAMMAKSLLDSANIPCFLKDENIVRMQWMWSNLIGGIRLQVRLEDLEVAENMLSQPIPETIALGEGEEYQQPRCPYCQSLNIGFEAIYQEIGLASIIVAVPVRLPKNRWKCRACNKEWSDPASKDYATDLE